MNARDRMEVQLFINEAKRNAPPGMNTDDLPDWEMAKVLAEKLSEYAGLLALKSKPDKKLIYYATLAAANLFRSLPQEVIDGYNFPRDREFYAAELEAAMRAKSGTLHN